MLLELRFSVCTLGLGTGTFFAALYGMNLKNFIEESDIGFWGVSGFSAAVSILVLMYGLGRLRRVQRVSMWGECGPERGLGLAKRGIQETIPRATEEKKRIWSWGFGRGTAGAGLGTFGGREERLERVARKLQASDAGDKRGSSQRDAWHRDQWHHNRRRRFAHPEGEATATSTTGGLGNTGSGLGTGKPPGGSTVLE
jgi:hypothetical protein